MLPLHNFFSHFRVLGLYPNVSIYEDEDYIDYWKKGMWTGLYDYMNKNQLTSNAFYVGFKEGLATDRNDLEILDFDYEDAFQKGKVVGNTITVYELFEEIFYDRDRTWKTDEIKTFAFELGKN